MSLNGSRDGYLFSPLWLVWLGHVGFCKYNNFYVYTFMFVMEELHSSPVDGVLEPASSIFFFFLKNYLFKFLL